MKTHHYDGKIRLVWLWVTILVFLVAGAVVWYCYSSLGQRTSASVRSWSAPVLPERPADESVKDSYAVELAKIDEEVKKRQKKEQQAAAERTFQVRATGPHRNPAMIDVVVNKKNPMTPLQFVPNDLTIAYGATMSAKAIGDFKAMYEAARAAKQPFLITSSYRSYAQQISTYNYWVSTGGRAQADTYSARAGYSEHQTGFVIDVATEGCVLECFAGTSQYKWMQTHAADYGFIQRYYAGYESTTGYVAEAWHYRYVGKAIAKDMKAKGVKTLEQYWGVKGGDY